MRCSRCGNDNPTENRFCGMCGATLLAPTPPPVAAIPETQTQRAASAVAGIPSPVVTAPEKPVEPPRPTAPAARTEPSISGPSFLGLNDPAPRKRASLSIDPHHGGSSGNLDYLLEDDGEEHKGGGSGKAIFILVVLAIVVGFGYLRYRNNGFRWSTSAENKPPAAEQTPPDSGASAPTTASPSVTPQTQPPVASQPAAPAPHQAAPDKAETPATPPSTTPTNVAPAKNDDTRAAGQDNSADNSDTTGADNSDTAPPPAPAKPAKAEVPKVAKPAPVKPSAAAAKPARAADPVSEAQRYLYGKGAPQDCDRGLRLLKPEANKANPKAMIEMGALYSAGLCTPRDLPTAYRWFAQALRKDPDNMSVQTDLQKLWGEMTQPERQLAIKLSQ